MAKKKTPTDTFLKILYDLVVPLIMDGVHKAIHDFQDAIYTTTRKVLESILAMILMIVALVMIISALPFVLSSYLDVPASLMVMFIGFILLLVSVLAFKMINKSNRL